MKRVFLASILFASFLSIHFHDGPIALHAENVTVSFDIINDDQEIDSIAVMVGEYVFLPQVGVDILARDNVVLSGWFKNENLTNPFYAEDETITTSLTLYSEWRYLNDSIRKAVIQLSETGQTFETGSVTLSLPLYEPLAQGVTYQWQSRLVGAPAWIDIEEAQDASYTPNRNGTFEFRVKYYVQQWISGTWTEVRKESESITITLQGAFDWQVVYYPLGILLIAGLVFWVKRKQPIDYYIQGERVNRLYVDVYEDISVQPTMEKAGYIFSGWFTDPQLQHRFEGMRMPRKKVNLYGEFRKKV